MTVFVLQKLIILVVRIMVIIIILSFYTIISLFLIFNICNLCLLLMFNIWSCDMIVCSIRQVIFGIFITSLIFYSIVLLSVILWFINKTSYSSSLTNYVNNVSMSLIIHCLVTISLAAISQYFLKITGNVSNLSKIIFPLLFCCSSS